MAFLIQHWPHVKFSETSVLSKANFIFILQFTVLTNLITHRLKPQRLKCVYLQKKEYQKHSNMNITLNLNSSIFITKHHTMIR